MCDVYPDVQWGESIYEILAREAEIDRLEKLNGGLLVRSGIATRQLGQEMIRSGNMEAKLGVEIARRIVADGRREEREPPYRCRV